MPTYNGNGSDSHSQDQRIERLEDTTDKLLVQSTETALKLDFLGKQFEEGMSTLSGKLEASFEKINESLDRGTKHMTGTDNRIEKLEAKEKARSNRWAFVKKSFVPLLIAAGSVLATKFGEVAWLWLTR